MQPPDTRHRPPATQPAGAAQLRAQRRILAGRRLANRAGRGLHEFDADTGRPAEEGRRIAAAARAARFHRGAAWCASSRRGRGERGRSCLLERRRRWTWWSRRPADHGPGPGASRRDRGLVRNHHLCPGQRLRRQVAGGHRRSGQEGPGARDHRDAGTRCRARRGAGAAAGLAGPSRSRARPRPNSAKTTNERWRDSPKGVVSEQEREAKKADYESAEARLYAAQAQVALDKSRVDQYTALTRVQAGHGALRRHHHRAQDRHRQSRDRRQQLDDDASVPHERRPIRCACSSTCRRARQGN